MMDQGTHEAAPPIAWASDALRDVAAERRRQIEVEGWAPDHNDKHYRGEMALAAACYAAHTSVWQYIGQTRLANGVHAHVRSAQEFVSLMWPWSRSWWKPKTDRENLVRAAALLLAEIERLDRSAT